MKFNNKRGISLVTLVVTIVIIIILSSVVILTVAGDGIIENVKKSTFQNDVKVMQEELATYLSHKSAQNRGQYDVASLYADKDILKENQILIEGKNIKDIITSITDEYLDILAVKNGELMYIGQDLTKLEWTYEIMYGIKGDHIKEVELDDSGYVSLQDCSNLDLVDYKIYGNSVQNGEPSPDSPVQVQSVGDRTINLLDIEHFANIDNWKNLSGTYAYYDFKLEPGTYTYKIETDLKAYKNNILMFNKNAGSSVGSVATIISGGSEGTIVSKIGKFTVEEGSTMYLNWYCANQKNQQNLNNLIEDVLNNFIIVEGSYTQYNFPRYEPYGYKIPINVRGNNLVNHLDVRESTSTAGSLTGAEITPQYINMVRKQTYDYANIPVSLKANTDYTLWYEYEIYDRPENSSGNTTVRMGFGTTVKSVNHRTEGVYNAIYNYTPTEDTVTNIQVIANYGSPVPAKVKFKVMLVEGTYTLDNIPEFTPNVDYNIYLDEPLRKIGDAVDYIDFRNKEIVRSVGKEGYDGNTSFGLTTGTYWNSEGVTTAFTHAVPTDALQDSLGIPVISNMFKYYKSSNIDKTKPYISGNIGQIVFATLNTTASSVSELQTLLQKNKMMYIYKLLKPSYSSIEFPDIKLNKGVNYITIGTEIAPLKANILYYED